MKYKNIINYPPQFKDDYSRNGLPKLKDGVYIINLYDYKSIGTHWIALCMNGENVTSFYRFRVDHIPKEI